MAAPLPDATLATPAPPPLPSLVNARRLRSQRLGRALRLWVPAGVLILLLAICFLLPLVVTLPSSTNGNIIYNNEPPFSPGHCSAPTCRASTSSPSSCYGGQVAFEIGVAVTVIGIVIGGTLGVIAGYFGGWVDAVISRVLDILIAFPALVLALVIAEGLGPSELHVIWALSVFGIPAVGRIARGATLTIRGLPYMTAARLSGTRPWRIIARHILPNIVPGIVTFSLLGIGVVIILEGALDFLGYGIPLPESSWGSMIANGQQVLTAQPEYVLIPSHRPADHRGGAEHARRRAARAVGGPVSRQSTDALLQVEDLRVAFAAGGREIRAVDGVSYQVDAGRTLAIIGESGSGKTVGCRAIMGLLPRDAAISGSARLRGTELIGLSDAELRKHRGQRHGHGLPGPGPVAQPDDAGRRADHRGDQDAPQGQPGPRRAPRRSSCCGWSASPRPSAGSTSTRTSCPAACGSAS